MSKNQAKYNVLVLEDEPSLKEAIRVKLIAAGAEPTVFDDGRQALESIKQRGQHFDGVWLDFDVHQINGLEFMQAFIKIPDWEHCPVLIVSNTGNPELIEQAITLGAKGWIIKAEVRLDDTINRFLEIIDQTKADS